MGESRTTSFNLIFQVAGLKANFTAALPNFVVRENSTKQFLENQKDNFRLDRRGS
jgi:hypothetical protein